MRGQKRVEDARERVTRASILVAKSFGGQMDCRVKPGNDGVAFI
jgi:hypothetical protein